MPIHRHYFPADALLYVVNVRDDRACTSAWELYLFAQMNSRAGRPDAPVLVVLNTPSPVSAVQRRDLLPGLCRIFSRDALPPGGTPAWRRGWAREACQSYVLTLTPYLSEEGVLSVSCTNMAGVEQARLQLAGDERPAELHARVVELLGVHSEEGCHVALALHNGRLLNLEDALPVSKLLQAMEVSESAEAGLPPQESPPARDFCDDVLPPFYGQDFLCEGSPHLLRIHRDHEASPPLDTFHNGRWCVTAVDVLDHVALCSALAFLGDALSAP